MSEQKNILVINSGSSSIKFQLINPETEEVILKGAAKNLGLPQASMELLLKGQDMESASLTSDSTHTSALESLFGFLRINGLLESIAAVGHRIVHGGSAFSESALITPEVIRGIEAAIPYAPLHNPANMLGIRAIDNLRPDLPQVAVFDTAFHASMPDYAYHYAIPQAWYKNHGIRRYGFHGTSYRFILDKTAKVLGKAQEELNLIVAHLGAGASLAAIKDGQSVDTTMGLTPLEGVSMATRSGDLDASIIPLVMEHENLTAEEVVSKLNTESGNWGVSGLSTDLREIIAAAAEGDEDANLAINIFTHRCAKYIAALMTSLPSLDALVFTAGVGEDGISIRAKIVERLKIFGFLIDANQNDTTIVSDGKEGLISTPKSKYPIYVLATNEELMIARDTKNWA